MTVAGHSGDTGLLTDWADDQRRARRRARRGSAAPAARGGLRFAFYGRVSTQDFQDPESSRAWQRSVADEVISGKGSVVAEFFDHGYSRRTAWPDRPQAAVLLTALADPERGFDAVVVGAYERAFFGDQLIQLLPLLAQHGVQLWLPETNGPVDGADPTHQALIVLLGTQSKREVLRSRFRVLAAMQAQVREQGRYLGGRPPYGYRLADAGPHPNTAHARWGRRLQRLVPEPVTARHVQWIFAQRLAGRSASSIAHELNDRGVPAHPAPIRPATHTARVPVGRCARSRPFWLTLAIPAGRSGTGNASTTTRPPTDEDSERSCGGISHRTG
jgi:site-specific DNA recombinase